MEVWKDVVGFEGYYQVSNKGRVRSLVKCNAHPEIPRILKPLCHRQGYQRVELMDAVTKMRKCCLIHRLVAEAFIANNNAKKYINHKDGDKANNAVENLEWVTSGENQAHAVKTGLKPPKLGDENIRSTPIMQLSKSGKLLKIWAGFGEIKRAFGDNEIRNIHACCKGKQKTAYGYLWKYAGEEVM